MELEIQFISKEIIRPSSPTPNDLRHYRLSSLDQTCPPLNNAIVLFYQSDGDSRTNQIEKSNHLKQSLSEVLKHYYPLAGRIKDNLSVDCNDQGVPFLETQVKCKLPQILENPVPSELVKLSPSALEAGEFLLGIQFNTFQCGGIAIGIAVSHKVADASSVSTFIKTWAASARGEANITHPEFLSATLFPPLNKSELSPFPGNVRKNLVAKRFVFSKSSIDSLKERYGALANADSSGNLRPPSRVEALSVFLWSRFSQVGPGPSKTCALVHTVNLRPRMEPPLPENAFGNYFWTVFVVPPSSSSEESFDLVGHMRESVSKIDSEFIQQLQKGRKNSRSLVEETSAGSSGIGSKLVFLAFTSLCRFPFYDSDFGWGKPVWTGVPCLTLKNELVVFSDTASGGGIEAVLHLDAEDMVKFQEDPELLQFVDPPGY